MRSREALKKFPTRISKDHKLSGFRWVVEKSGELKLTIHECFSCHSRVTSDGIAITGGQGRGLETALSASSVRTPFSPTAIAMLNGFSVPKEAGAPPDSPTESTYAPFGAPWIKGDIHERIKSMSPEELQALSEADLPEHICALQR